MWDNLVAVQKIIILMSSSKTNPVSPGQSMNSTSNYLTITYELLVTKNNIALHATKAVTKQMLKVHNMSH